MSTSDVEIDRESGVVTKTIRSKFSGYGLVKREAYWLRRLHRDSDRFPEVLKLKGDVIQTAYMGERIERDTVPSDWSSQMASILEVMFYTGVRHNDIKPHDILVMDGRLCLIDFGWAQPICENVPLSWPKGLGGIFRTSRETPNDRLSFIRSISYVMRHGRYDKQDIKPL